MVKTGSEIYAILSIVATIVPLLPVIILFIRHASPSPFVHLLRIVCLLAFVHNLSVSISIATNYQQFVTTAFRLAAFTVLYYLFTGASFSQRIRQLMLMLLVSSLSVIITIYALQGINAYPVTIPVLQSLVLVIFATATLFTLINNQRIVLFREPLFWIAGGVLCYYGMYLLMEIITRIKGGMSPETEQEKQLVYWLAGLGQFAFYSIAASAVPRHRSRLP